MGPELAIAIAAISTGVGVAASASQAQQRNRAVEASIASQKAAADKQAAQLGQQFAQQRADSIRKAHLLSGRITALQSEAGGTLIGSAEALQQQATFDAGRNISAAGVNYTSGVGSILDAYGNQTQSTASQVSNPLMQGFLGGLQGLQTGLQIGGIGRAATPATSPDATGGATPEAQMAFFGGGTP